MGQQFAEQQPVARRRQVPVGQVQELGFSPLLEKKLGAAGDVGKFMREVEEASKGLAGSLNALQASLKIDDETAHEAASAFERAERQRERERRKDEAAREREQKRRRRAIAKAEAALAKAKREHDEQLKDIEAERAAIDERSQAETARWEKQKAELETALPRARD